MKIKIFLLITGENVISFVEEDTEGFCVLVNPYVLKPNQTEQQTPLVPYAKEGSGIKLFRSSIVAECDPSSGVKASYAEKFEFAM